MPIYNKTILVATDDVDINRHVNNVRYVQWMQDVAVEHSEFVGCDRELYQSLDASWVARSHHIDYIQPSFIGDVIELSTWIDRFRKVSCFRKYEFRRQAQNELLASAETEWVYLSTKSGRPTRIDNQVFKNFESK